MKRATLVIFHLKIQPQHGISLQNFLNII